MTSNLGVDSFSEVFNFDYNEAVDWGLFFIKSINVYARYDKLFYVIVFSIFLFWLIRDAKDVFLNNIALILLSMVFCFLFFKVNDAIKMMVSAKNSLNSIQSNFSGYDAKDISVKNDIKTIVYIGESTTSMHMGIYGYPRNTTPNLDDFNKNDAGFLLFKNVVSTHSHTSSSLLEALSFPVESDTEIKSIYKRRRISITDVLQKSGVNVNLYSNQGQTGSWNIASQIIFKNSKNKFSTESRFMGNSDNKLEKPFDHEFFASVNLDDKGVYFLHSYAGHGNYLKNIPFDYRAKVDDFYKGLDGRAIFGVLNKDVNIVEGYDSAIKYVDFSVAEVIGRVKHMQEPAVFVYFSDHGDSAFTGRGHDSSSFSHEMIRVPLVIYFNQHAINAYPHIYEKYKKLSAKNKLTYLSEIPWIIAGLYDASLDQFNFDNHGKIMVRDKSDGVDYFDFSLPSGGVKNSVNEIFAISNIASPDDVVCYHRANSIGSILRGAVVSNCLEIDVVFEKGDLYAFHPPKENHDLKLSDVIHKILPANKNIWLDMKNMKTLQACNALSKTLKSDGEFRGGVFVELSPGSYKNMGETSVCIEEMRAGGVRFSQYMRNYMDECSVESKCEILESDLDDIISSGIFDEISFDFKQYLLFEKSLNAKKIKMNTWGVEPKNYINMKGNFERIIIYNNDPNKY